MSSAERTEVVEQLNDLGQLAAGVGHHVINAFSAIVSNAELLRLSAETPGGVIDPLAQAEAIIRTAVDASGVARRLIDYSRSATATGEACLELEKIVAEFVARESPRSPGGIEWITDLEPVPPIRGNPAQINTLLGHLIRNSLEAMPQAGGTIALRTGVDDRGWVVLEVRDTGMGMSSRVQERAVEPFFTTKIGHIGVGLSIANGIWRRHRGTLALQSRAGEGTRIRLCVEPDRSTTAP